LHRLLNGLLESLEVDSLVGVLEEDEALVWLLAAALTEVVVPLFDLSPFLSHIGRGWVALVELVNLAVHVLLKYHFAKGTLPDSKRRFSDP